MSVRALPDAHPSGKVHVACMIIKPATVDNTWSRPNSDTHTIAKGCSKHLCAWWMSCVRKVHEVGSPFHFGYRHAAFDDKLHKYLLGRRELNIFMLARGTPDEVSPSPFLQLGLHLIPFWPSRPEIEQQRIVHILGA